MNKNIIIGALAVLVIVFGTLYLSTPRELGGVSPDKYFQNNFLAGLTVGLNGSVVSQYKCNTASWDPSSVSSSTAQQTLDIANTGASVGDIAFASLSSVTSTALWNVSAKVTGSATTTIFLNGVGGDAIDLSTTTAKVCTIQ